MTLQQGLAFGLIALTIGAFVWGRFRFDLVAVVALVAGLAVGVIPAEAAFDGFKNDVTVIIACALIVSAAFARSGIVELAMRRVLPLLKTERSQVPVLTTAVTVLSMATKNVGALAIMMPVALQVARRTGSAPSRLLMPMAFGAMAGGMVTLVGTAPNIIVSEVRQQIVGEPFAMYDFAPVGLAITAMALAFLAVGYRILPKDRRGATQMNAALAANAYATEVIAPEDWVQETMTVSALAACGEGDVRIMALLRAGKRRPSPRGNVVVRPGDVLLVEGEQQALQEFIARSKLKLIREDRPIAMENAAEEIAVVEAVIGRNSPLQGQSVKQSDLYGRHGINLLGVSRSGYELTQHLRTAKLAPGDIVLLQGAEQSLPTALQALDLLPLAEREVRLGSTKKRFLPAAVLAVAMILVGFGLVPVAVAFFGAAVVIVALGGLKMREAYAALDGPLLVFDRRTDPGIGCDPADGRVGPDRRSAPPRVQRPAGSGRGGGGSAGLDGGDAVPEQRRHGSDRRADRRHPGQAVGLQRRPIPDGGGGGRSLRLPDAHRASVQHTGHGARRLSVRRLSPAGGAFERAGPSGRAAADPAVLAAVTTAP